MSLSRDTGPIVGIDLGTTNSLVARVKEGQPEILLSREGQRLIPSVVTLEQGVPVVGYSAKRQKTRKARDTVYSVKRLLGRDVKDLAGGGEQLPYEVVSAEGVATVRLGDRLYSAVEISAMILREARLSAELALGQPVKRAVITVPAYFNDNQRQATRTAGRLAGLEVLRIINEPTAAALAYGLDRKKNGLIAVYDLGGGTFDVSILQLHDGIFEVLSTNGDTQLGGDDLDQVMAERMSEEVHAKTGIDPRKDSESYAEVLEACEKVKIELARSEQSTFRALGYERVWKRHELDQVLRPSLERTRKPCLDALKDAGLDCKQLTDVILVGGPTRLECVKQMVREIFGREPDSGMNPDEVVAAGAAIQADILAGNNKNFLLLDVAPLSLGIETYGGIVSVLIPRNSRIPTAARETFTTFVDHQTAVDIHVLQGEREKVEDNRSLARFKLRGITPLPAGRARVEVTFLIDADGILQVSARDLMTGREQGVEVRPSFGLTEAEIEKMLLASLEHAQEDVTFRKLVDARNEAEPTLRSTERRLSEAEKLLSQPEFAIIQERVRGLKTALQGSDPGAIKKAAEDLNQATLPLANILVHQAIETKESTWQK